MNKQLTVFDGRFQHPFNCIVAGPSQSGKSTFVKNLLNNNDVLITNIFEYVVLVSGPKIKKDGVFSLLVDVLKEKLIVIEIDSIYSSQKQFEDEFPNYLRTFLQEKKSIPGCIIFDDLMSRLAKCDLLVTLFTEISSHFNVSIIHITQNLFYSVGGRNASVHTTLYSNTHYLILFKNLMDNRILSTVSRRLGSTSQKINQIMQLMDDIVTQFRYVIIHGRLSGPKLLKFTSDIFNQCPIPFQRDFNNVNE